MDYRCAICLLAFLFSSSKVQYLLLSLCIYTAVILPSLKLKFSFNKFILFSKDFQFLVLVFLFILEAYYVIYMSKLYYRFLFYDLILLCAVCIQFTISCLFFFAINICHLWRKKERKKKTFPTISFLYVQSNEATDSHAHTHTHTHTHSIHTSSLDNWVNWFQIPVSHNKSFTYFETFHPSTLIYAQFIYQLSTSIILVYPFSFWNNFTSPISEWRTCYQYLPHIVLRIHINNCI